MKIRSGIDLVGVGRILNLISRDKQTFFEKVYTENERAAVETSSSPNRRAERYAARFAAKEAAAKALGTGICTDGIAFTDIEIGNDDKGAPFVIFHGRARERAEEIKMISASVSLSHEKEYATAVCMLLTDEEDR